MLEHICNYYENYDEDGRLIATNHGQVEYLTTMRYIEKYLLPETKIVEIGAGTGRYSHALARMGHRVDAVELVPHNIQIFERNTMPGENITIRQGNATDLGFIADGQYDMTLLLGPMYHLFTDEEKHKALSEALRVTKKGGLVFVAYCVTDSSIMDYGFRRGNIHDLIEKCMLDPNTFDAIFRRADVFVLHRKEEIDAMMSPFHIRRLHYVATDLYTNHMRDAVDAMDEQTFALYLRYHFAICERPDMLGITHHSLDIFRKE